MLCEPFSIQEPPIPTPPTPFWPVHKALGTWRLNIDDRWLSAMVVPDIRKMLLEGAWSVALMMSRASMCLHWADKDQFPSFGMDSTHL